jgi:hypothetical protein
MTPSTFLPKDYDIFIGLDVDKNNFYFTVKDHHTMRARVRGKSHRGAPLIPACGRQAYLLPIGEKGLTIKN